MFRPKKMPEIDAAVQFDDWEYIQVHAPAYADAVQARIDKSDSPKEIYRYVLQMVGPAREGIALRCLHAAQFLQNEKEQGA